MIVLRRLIVLVLVSLCNLAFGKEDGELKAVIVLFRHGDRSPLSSWPNDKYFGDSSLWPDGYGQLNNLGKERHYRLGQWFRNRYDGFLPARYNRSDIYVRSTDVDRTLTSAAYNLAGLYPPSGDQIWNENMPWQGIPIHTTLQSIDTILTDHVSCPKHDKLKQELLNSTEFQRFNQEHAELYKNISEVTGYPLSEISVHTFSELFSTITIYREFNLTLPDWTEYYWPEIETFGAKQFQIRTYTQELARLAVGPYNNYLVNYLKSIKGMGKRTSSKKEEAPPEVTKFLMLSAHDSTIADRTNAIGIFPGVVPEFASALIYEVKSKNGSNSDLYLNIYFKNSTGLSPLTVPGCDLDCDIDNYAEIVKPVTVALDQWTQECYEKEN